MITNPFKHYGIDHLSPSSCNQFAAQPAVFVLQKILKKPVFVGVAAHRGNAVERGIEYGLKNREASLADCVNIAMEEFRILTPFSQDPKLGKERESIPGFVEQGVKELRPYGIPSATQQSINVTLEDVDVPFTGYIDFEWAATNILIDLKSTHALPSKIDQIGHARQVALYAHARGGEVDARIAYITSKKAATYQLENIAEHVKSLRQIALTIQRFLSLSADPMELASFVVPDIDHYYYNDGITRQAAYEIWKV